MRKKIVFFLSCLLLVPASLFAESAIRPRSTGAPYQYTAPPPPAPEAIVPGNRPERAHELTQNKEFQPWEYERNDDALARDLQQSIDQSFLEGRIRLNPISPKRIKEVQRDSIAVEEARQMPTPEKGLSRFKALSLQPGASIPDVHLFPANTTMLRFMDSTGSPWPILSYVVGNAEGFQVQRAGGGSENASNILIVTPTKTFADTSLAITLAPDVPTVLMLHASVRNTKPDYLVTFRADAPGPNAAQAAYHEEKTALVSETMLSFLDGIPPKGAKRMKTDKVMQAWEFDGKCYVRTDKSLVWPAYSSIVRSRSAHDMRVYELPKVSSIVLSIAGSPHRLRLGSSHEMGDFERSVKDQHNNQMER